MFLISWIGSIPYSISYLSHLLLATRGPWGAPDKAHWCPQHWPTVVTPSFAHRPRPLTTWTRCTGCSNNTNVTCIQIFHKCTEVSILTTWKTLFTFHFRKIINYIFEINTPHFHYMKFIKSFPDMDTSDRSLTFEMYALNSTETDSWSQIPVGFDLPRMESTIFLLYGSTATCVFLTVKQFVRPMKHYDWLLVGGVWPRAVVGGVPRRIELLNFFSIK